MFLFLEKMTVIKKDILIITKQISSSYRLKWHFFMKDTILMVFFQLNLSILNVFECKDGDKFLFVSYWIYYLVITVHYFNFQMSIFLSLEHDKLIQVVVSQMMLENCIQVMLCHPIPFRSLIHLRFFADLCCLLWTFSSRYILYCEEFSLGERAEFQR